MSAIDLVALNLGYVVMVCIAVLALALAVDLGCAGGVYHFSVLGFGVGGFSARRLPTLYDKLLRIGYSPFRVGQLVFGLTYPRWVARLLRNICR